MLSSVGESDHADIGVRHHKDPLRPKVQAHGFEVFNVGVNAPGECRRIVGRIRPAAVANVVEDDGAVRREALPVGGVEETVGHDHRLAAAPVAASSAPSLPAA